MGLISDMETVHGREIARLMLLMFILAVLIIGFIALLFFLFIHFGLIGRYYPPIHVLSGGFPILVLGGILLIIPFGLFVWWFLAKYSFGKKFFTK